MPLNNRERTWSDLDSLGGRVTTLPDRNEEDSNSISSMSGRTYRSPALVTEHCDVSRPSGRSHPLRQYSTASYASLPEVGDDWRTKPRSSDWRGLFNVDTTGTYVSPNSSQYPRHGQHREPSESTKFESAVSFPPSSSLTLRRSEAHSPRKSSLLVPDEHRRKNPNNPSESLLLQDRSNRPRVQSLRRTAIKNRWDKNWRDKLNTSDSTVPVKKSSSSTDDGMEEVHLAPREGYQLPLMVSFPRLVYARFNFGPELEWI